MNKLDNNFKLLINKYINKTKAKFNKNKYLYLLSYLHYSVISFVIGYPFLIILFNYQGDFNNIYLIMTFTMLFHWVINNDECILSFMIKKLVNNKYKSGDLYFMSLDCYYNIYTKKWIHFNKTFNNYFNQLTFITLLNIILYMVVVIYSNISLLNKVIILFWFVLLNLIYNKKAIKYITKLNKTLLKQNNKLYQL